MRVSLFIAIHIIISLFIILLLYFYDSFLGFFGFIFIFSGLILTGVLIVHFYILTAILLGYHIVITIFTIWLYINQSFVFSKPSLHMVVFTNENIRLAIITLIGACLTILLSWFLFAKRRRSSEYHIAKVLKILGESVKKIKPSIIYMMIVFSITFMLFFYITNPTIIEIPYPQNRHGQWLSNRFFIITFYIAVCALIFSYMCFIQYGIKFKALLYIARINFIIISILFFLLVGSRTQSTFFFLLFSIGEFFLIFRRQGSVFFMLIFLLLAWVLYQSGSIIRTQLSIFPLHEVLIEAILNTMFISSQESISYNNQRIDLEDYKIISLSLFHLLYTIDLIDNGISLEGSTFLNLIPQSLPKFLDGIIWERPLNDNYRLSMYYSHGGGFFILANAYWNGGLLVALITIFLFSMFSVFLDNYAQQKNGNKFYRIIYFLFLPLFIGQVGYGIQGLVRIYEALIVIIIFREFFKKRMQKF